MADLLKSSAVTQTQAPTYYNDYLTNLASRGQNAAQNAQFVGAQPLQQLAFDQVQKNLGTYKPVMQTAQNYLGQATNTNPLSAAQPYLSNANVDQSELAKQYMSPYTQDVVNSIGALGQRNIQQNLAPQATAAAVGSGQFGSQRGAQVLGQTIQNANTDILAQQNQALQAGYQNAMANAQKQQALEAQLGQTAGNLAGTNQTNLINASNVGANMANQTQAMNLNDINALGTYGGQQQQIAQNQQLFPLQTLGTEAGLLRGYTIPTTSAQTFEGSPLSAIASLGSTVAGLTNTTTYKDANGNIVTNPSTLTNISNAIGSGWDWLKSKLDTSPTYNQTGTGTTGMSGSDISTGFGGTYDWSNSNLADQSNYTNPTQDTYYTV